MATNGGYGATYPRIQTDPNINYPASQYNIQKITVEEWNDLLHHTHKLCDIQDNDGNFLDSGSSQDLSGYVKREDYDALAETVASLIERVAELESRISSGGGDLSGITIGDYDLDTPGIQDENGNTIG